MKPTFRLGLAVLLTLPLLGACSAAAAGGASGGNADLITREQIDASAYNNAYEIVQRLRPRWLRSRNAPSSFSDGVRDPRTNAIHVGPSRTRLYLDGVHYGPVSDLARIPADEIERLEWLSATDATQRYGTGNDDGAILITSRRGQRTSF